MIAKPRPKLLEKREAKAQVAAEDRAENAKVRKRSDGFCEVRIEAYRELIVTGTLVGESTRVVPYIGHANRCHRRAGHIHHLISGIGRRNIGKSIKADHKLHVCELHHEEIHGHVLKPVNELERYDAATVCYERIK